MRISLFILLIVGFGQNASAKYQVNDNCKKAWMLLMDFEINSAKSLLESEIRTNPTNYYAYFLEQTCDAYELLLNSGDKEYVAFQENYEKRRQIMDDKDTDSPYYLSCSSEMDLQLGIFNIINGSKISGLRKAYSSYKNVYKNLEIHPGFLPSLKLDAFYNVAIANLPPFVKWAISTFGVSGNVEYGFKILRNNYEQQKNIVGINAEAALFVILSAKLNKTPELVYDFVNSLNPEISKTFILSYFKANIAYRTGKNEEALKTIKTININSKPQGENIYNYLMGKILLRKLDNSAGLYFKKYLSFTQKIEYVKEINYAMACIYLINNDLQNFNKYKYLATEKGNVINERDRESLYDAKLDYTPDIDLLKAHLSIDGEYLNNYFIYIQRFEHKKSNFKPYVLEYNFLEGRYNALVKNDNKAIELFKDVIEEGSDLNYYFASEACLRLGKIYERLNQKESARYYYEKALKLYDSNYYEYIEDKANKALNNLN